MAESKGSLIAKSVQKHAGRAKEKVKSSSLQFRKILQNLGKVDRTADDIFDEHLQNFTRQHNAATRLQKEFNNYIRCIRAVQAASKTLMDSLNEIYESQWTGHDLLYVQTQNAEMLWQDFSHKLGDQVLIPLNTYQAQFPEMRKKIEKRNRKLVDYDSQRHNMQSLQGTNVTKKRDESKVAKARDMLEEAKRTYEVLNSELHDELPALYDSRVLFLVTNLQTLFAAEQVFHSETAKVYAELEAIVDKLANDCQRGSYTLKKISNSPQSINSNSTNKVGSPTPTTVEELSPPPSPVKDDSVVSADSPPPINTTTTTNGHASSPSPTPTSPNNSVNITLMTTTATTTITDTSPTVRVTNGTSSPPPAEGTPSSPDKNELNDVNHSKQQVEELYDIPSGATTEGLPPGVLYRVKATYKYTREDVDELSFEVGEIIRVVQYDDPEEQEEGWLMGVKESSGEKGMFPANFTRPL
ncbi:amphiphysin isoform X2 [Lycorma delicatula]|uniref:amphiphysin isoform X2 n=1 Tax=Lycorma delicatula TaxID=130591 RepID=UPI003F514F93